MVRWWWCRWQPDQEWWASFGKTAMWEDEGVAVSPHHERIVILSFCHYFIHTRKDSVLYYQMFQFSVGILSSFGKTALGGGSVSLCHYIHARIVICSKKSLLDDLCAHIRGGNLKTKQIMLPVLWHLREKQKWSYMGTTQINYTNINSPYVPSWRSDPANKFICLIFFVCSTLWLQTRPFILRSFL